MCHLQGWIVGGLGVGSSLPPRHCHGPMPWGTDAPKMERLSWSTGRGSQMERPANRQTDGQASEPTGMVEGQIGEADGKGTGEEDG